MLPKTSSFSISNKVTNYKQEIERLIKVAKNMGYKFQVQVQEVGPDEITTVTWFRRK